MKLFSFLIVILLLAVIGSFCVSSFSYSPVYAGEDYGLEKAAEEAGFKEAGEETAKLPVIIGRIVRIVLAILGLVLVVIIIIGGFTWMTSGGSEDKVKKARRLIANGIIGLAIVVFSYVIANFIIQRLVEAGG